MAKTFLKGLGHSIALEFGNSIEDAQLKDSFVQAIGNLPHSKLKKELNKKFEKNFKRLQSYLKDEELTELPSISTSINESLDELTKEELDGRKDITEQSNQHNVQLYNFYEKKKKLKVKQMKKLSNLERIKIYRMFLKKILDNSDISDTLIEETVKDFKDTCDIPHSDLKLNFEWLPVCSNLLELTSGCKPYGYIRMLRNLFNSIQNDVNNCLAKEKAVRSGRLSEVLKNFIITSHLEVSSKTLQTSESKQYYQLMSALLSIYVDLCAVHSSKVESRTEYGKDITGFIGYILHDVPESQLEVLLQLSCWDDDKKFTVLWPLLNKCLEVRPQKGYHRYYLKYLLLVRQVKDSHGEYDHVIKWNLETKSIPASDGFLEWLNNHCPEANQYIPTEDKKFRRTMITKFLLEEAEDDLLTILLDSFGGDVREVVNETESDKTLEQLTCEELFYLDTGTQQSNKDTKEKNEESPDNDPIIIKTLEEMQKLINVEYDSRTAPKDVKGYKLEKNVAEKISKNPETRKFLESEIISITPLNTDNISETSESEAETGNSVDGLKFGNMKLEMSSMSSDVGSVTDSVKSSSSKVESKDTTTTTVTHTESTDDGTFNSTKDFDSEINDTVVFCHKSPDNKTLNSSSSSSSKKQKHKSSRDYSDKFTMLNISNDTNLDKKKEVETMCKIGMDIIEFTDDDMKTDEELVHSEIENMNDESGFGKTLKKSSSSSTPKRKISSSSSTPKSETSINGNERKSNERELKPIYTDDGESLSLTEVSNVSELTTEMESEGDVFMKSPKKSNSKTVSSSMQEKFIVKATKGQKTTPRKSMNIVEQKIPITDSESGHKKSDNSSQRTKSTEEIVSLVDEIKHKIQTSPRRKSRNKNQNDSMFTDDSIDSEKFNSSLSSNNSNKSNKNKSSNSGGVKSPRDLVDMEKSVKSKSADVSNSNQALVVISDSDTENKVVVNSTDVVNESDDKSDKDYVSSDNDMVDSSAKLSNVDIISEGRKSNTPKSASKDRNNASKPVEKFNKSPRSNTPESVKKKMQKLNVTPKSVQKGTPEPIQKKTPKPNENKTPGLVQKKTPEVIQKKTPNPNEKKTPNSIQKKTPKPHEKKGSQSAEKMTPKSASQKTPESVEKKPRTSFLANKLNSPSEKEQLGDDIIRSPKSSTSFDLRSKHHAVNNDVEKISDSDEEVTFNPRSSPLKNITKRKSGSIVTDEVVVLDPKYLSPAITHDPKQLNSLPPREIDDVSSHKILSSQKKRRKALLESDTENVRVPDLSVHLKNDGNTQGKESVNDANSSKVDLEASAERKKISPKNSRRRSTRKSVKKSDIMEDVPQEEGYVVPSRQLRSRTTSDSMSDTGPSEPKKLRASSARKPKRMSEALVSVPESVDEEHVLKTPTAEKRGRILSASTSKKVVAKAEQVRGTRKRRLSSEFSDKASDVDNNSSRRTSVRKGRK